MKQLILNTAIIRLLWQLVPLYLGDRSNLSQWSALEAEKTIKQNHSTTFKWKCFRNHDKFVMLNKPEKWPKKDPIGNSATTILGHAPVPFHDHYRSIIDCHAAQGCIQWYQAMEIRGNAKRWHCKDLRNLMFSLQNIARSHALLNK